MTKGQFVNFWTILQSRLVDKSNKNTYEQALKCRDMSGTFMGLTCLPLFIKPVPIAKHNHRFGLGLAHPDCNCNLLSQSLVLLLLLSQ